VAVLRGVSDGRVLRIGGCVHLSAAFLVGYTFREPTGWKIEALHRRGTVKIASIAAHDGDWRIVPRPAQNESDELVGSAPRRRSD